jgi:hypothetical protein
MYRAQKRNPPTPNSNSTGALALSSVLEVLAECCGQGHAAAAQVLLDTGAQPAVPDPKRGNKTALHAAAVTPTRN